MKRARLRAFLDAVTAIQAEQTDEQALTHIGFFPEWKADTDYDTGTRVQYGQVLYKCLIPHHSQSDWTPDTAHSLWVRVDDPAIEFPEWVQPTGATDAYRINAKVSHLGKHWISTIDYNVYEPSVYGWGEL